MFTPRTITLRTSLAFMLLLLAIASVIAGHPFQALAASTSSSSGGSPARRNDKDLTSSAPSLRQMYMHSEPHDHRMSPGFVAVLVGGMSVIVAGLMV
ncbi:uncharacterized protein LAJ45_08607 [Morchella importuna]|uniref:Transmembrane protein n=1 Tax=Morchella conica CCBAS932 TaxID=1392247 RepID=A0A3N4KP17_9PEZI|nr:uncharacterized protein LAJ45_08607 [Morchella importuna]KAH8147451.1 hypothetical protein LAJ45_08607 [Morchella importuna]RPB11159.1 hypothetical protein P167DRAFT_575464 [Morchella conica CCBAS932]